MVTEFQFYLSSIKSRRVIILFRTNSSFNSTLVQLKGTNGVTEQCFEDLFQFYLSSIKRQPEYRGIEERNMFQFYLSSIKRNEPGQFQTRLI